MSVDFTTIGITLLVLTAVLLVHWRGQRVGGAATKPNRQIGKLFAKLSEIEKALGNTATADDLELIRAEMKRVEGAAASSGEVLALEGKINHLRAELDGKTSTLGVQIAAVKETGEHTREGVSRIEAILLRNVR